MMPSNEYWLKWGQEQLKERLSTTDAIQAATILLCKALKVDKGALYAWPEKEVPSDIEIQYKQAIQRHQTGEPIAYILGVQEFWSMLLKVTEDTLIPRPETERLVEAVLSNNASDKISLLELGVGSGAIACAIAKERPNWDIIATDISKKALNVARENIRALQLKNVRLIQSNWFEKIVPQTFDIIVSNPPYVEKDSTYLNKETQFEPQTALISGKDGLDDITIITEQAKHYLSPNGALYFEHGFQQAKAVRDLLKQNGFILVETIQDYAGLDRVTFGRIG